MSRRIRSSIVCVHDNKILVFKAIDPTSGKEYHFLPGGEVEDHESAPQSAVREAMEETGYKVKVDEWSAVDKDYEFEWDGQIFLCTTLFYRAFLDQEFVLPQPVNDTDYNKGATWLPVSEINNIFSYSDDILDAVKELCR